MNTFDEAAVLGLQQYLIDNVTELNEVYDEFPTHNQEMNLPACSIITVGTPLYTNLQSYVHSRIPDPENALNDIVTEIIGMNDCKLQVDIWAEYKPKRSEILELVGKALNKQYFEQDLPQGLRLTLTDYYDVIASYDQVGYTYIDSEEDSQKAEWRVKLDLVVNYPKVAIKSMPRISEITIENQISETVNVKDGDTTIEETYKV